MMTTGMSAPPMDAVMCAPSTPASPVVAAAGRGGGPHAIVGRVRGRVGNQAGGWSRKKEVWSAGQPHLTEQACSTPQQAALTERRHAGARVSHAAADEGSARRGVARRQAHIQHVLACSGTRGGGGPVKTCGPAEAGVGTAADGKRGTPRLCLLPQPSWGCPAPHPPGRESGAEGSRPCSLPKATAEPVRVMAPMRVPRKVAVMCTPSRWAGSAVRDRRRRVGWRRGRTVGGG